MDKIEKNVILDLLPVYLAGEASSETISLVEDFAKHDPQIARLVKSGGKEYEKVANNGVIPEDLEMKTILRLRKNIIRKMIYVAAITIILLMIPLLAMQFDSGVNWSIFDFLVMGTLLSVTGFTYVIISGLSDSWLYRIATAIAILTGFLLIWVNLAVGFIGSENNPVNLLYLAVLATGCIGAGFSRFKSAGMSLTMFATAFVQFFVPVIALFVSSEALNEPPGTVGIFMLSGFFAALFGLAGLLFRIVSNKSGQ